MEQDKENPVVTAPTKQEREWKNPTDTIMKPREMGHVFGGSIKSSRKRATANPADTEVVIIAADQRVWTMQRARAREVAVAYLGFTSKDLEKASNELRVTNLMNTLLVVTRDGGVIVGNNPEHAKHLRSLDRNNFPFGLPEL